MDTTSSSTRRDPLERLRPMMARLGWSEEELIERAIRCHGSLEQAMKDLELAEVQNRAALERSFPNGWQGAKIKVGRKPNPGEEVLMSKLRDGVTIRVWGGDLAHYYSLDFINGEGKHMRTPQDIQIFSVETAFFPGMEVLSIEKSMANSSILVSQQLSDPAEFARTHDPNWETYMVPEGVLLRITQANKPDLFLQIPLQAYGGQAMLHLQPATQVSVHYS